MARDDLAASASRVLAVVARRGRSHGDDEAARRVGGGGVEADGGEGAGSAPLRRRREVVECGRGASFQVERAAALRWRGGGAGRVKCR